MVTNVTSLTGNGLKDWLIQRVTAVYLIVYLAAWVGYFMGHTHIDYDQWHALFQNQWVQVATILAVVSLVTHAWIGIWTVTTDYMTCTALRLSLQMVVLFSLLTQVLWCIKIVWGQ